MAHAEKCPVCNGKGKIDDKTCHGCGGTGWIVIQDAPIYIPSHDKYKGAETKTEWE